MINLFISLIIFINFSYSLPPTSDNEITRLINLIKSRLNINSIECSYTSTYFINPKLTGGEIISKTCVFSFKYSNGNFIVIREKNIEKENKIIENNSYNETPDHPTNLLELLAYKYSRYYHTNKEGVPTKKEGQSKLYYYFYKGTGKALFLDFVEGETKPTTVSNPAEHLDKFEDYVRFGDPRYLMGYIGLFLDEKDYPNFPIPRKITELIDFPGKTLFRGEGNNKVFLHALINPFKEKFPCDGYSSSVCNLIEEYLRWYSFEIWINNNNDIFKIVEIDYLPILYGEEFITKLCGYKEGNFKPFEIRRVFEFNDFQQFPGGIRFPIRGTITTYKYWLSLTNPDLTKDTPFIHEYYVGNNINEQEYRVLSHCYAVDEENYDYILTMEVHPETLKINHSIPENTFIPPEVNYPSSSPDKSSKLKKQNPEEPSYFKPYIFIASVVIITLVTMFITSHYLGWGK